MSEDDMFDLGEPEEAPEDESSDEQDETAEPSEPEDPLLTPAFPFEPELNQTIYVRQQTWSRFTDSTLSKVSAAGFESGLEDITTREIHEAAIQLANENQEALAEIVKQNREGSSAHSDSE